MSEENYTEPPETLGEYLRRHREASARDLDDISRATRVSKRYLEAFESDDLSRYPEAPFDKGFLRNYASEIGLDPDECVDRFERFKRATMPTQIREVKKVEKRGVLLGESSLKKLSDTKPAVWLGVVALLIIGLGVGSYFMFVQSGGDDVAQAPEIEILPEPNLSQEEALPSDRGTADVGMKNVLEVEANSRVNLLIRVDSLAEQEILLEPGQMRQIEFKNKVSVDGKDRAHVKLRLNGEAVALSDLSVPTILYNPSSVFP